MDNESGSNFMINDFKKHMIHYLILFLIIIIGGIGFFWQTDKTIKFLLAVMVAGGYVSWGIIHHYLEKNLSLKIVLEYLFMGILALVFLGGILL